MEPREGGIIVRYKSYEGGSYTHFGSCSSIQALESYFSSRNCHDTEILYVNPLVPRHMIPSGLKFSDDMSEELRVEFGQVAKTTLGKEKEGKEAEARSRIKQAADEAQHGASKDNYVINACPHCGKKNKVRALTVAFRPICGACGKNLLVGPA